MSLYVVTFREHDGSRCPCCLRAVPVASPEDSRGSGGASSLEGPARPTHWPSLTLMSCLLTSYSYNWHTSCSYPQRPPEKRVPPSTGGCPVTGRCCEP